MRGRVTVGGKVLAHLGQVRMVDARSETQRAADAAAETIGTRPVTVEWQQVLTDKEAAAVEMLFDSVPTNLPGRVQVTLPHDATPEQIERTLEGLREMFAPSIALDVVRAPAPPGPNDPRVTVTGGRFGAVSQAGMSTAEATRAAGRFGISADPDPFGLARSMLPRRA